MIKEVSLKRLVLTLNNNSDKKYCLFICINSNSKKKC